MIKDYIPDPRGADSEIMWLLGGSGENKTISVLDFIEANRLLKKLRPSFRSRMKSCINSYFHSWLTERYKNWCSSHDTLPSISDRDKWWQDEVDYWWRSLGIDIRDRGRPYGDDEEKPDMNAWLQKHLQLVMEDLLHL